MDGENVNVDDLFNEADLEQAALNIPLPGNDVVETPAQPVSLESQLALNELHSSGCRQRIAWSRLGCVASISDDSSAVNIQCLRLNRRTASWELSASYTQEIAQDEAVPHVYTHLCWSSTGTEFAVFDTRGRVDIFGMPAAVALNRFRELGCPNPDQGDELNQAVGAFWLPAIDRETPAISHLSKLNDQWATTGTKRKPIGPTWSRALLFATRLRDLRLLYIKPDRTWSEASATLDVPVAADDLLTHAAFAPTVDGSIFLATHSAKGIISAYSVQVNRPTLYPNQDPTTLSSITLVVQHISTNLHNVPSSTSAVGTDPMNGTTMNFEINHLSHLEVVPSTDIEKAAQIPPTIFAVNTIYSPTLNMNSSLQPKNIAPSTAGSLYTVPVTMHPRFDEIATKGTPTANVTPLSFQTLQRLPDVPFDGIIAFRTSH